MADSNLVARLRARTIMVPKPGTEPFVPTQPFWVTSDCGPHAAGEDAGLQYLPSYSTLGVSNAPTRVQAHMYVVEPLCKEAADALAEQAETIQRLRAALNGICSLACHEPMSAELAGRALQGAPETSDAR